MNEQEVFDAIEKGKQEMIMRQTIIDALEEENVSQLTQLGYTIHEGWGCDCPGGDDVITIVVKSDPGGRDIALYRWVEKVS